MKKVLTNGKISWQESDSGRLYSRLDFSNLKSINFGIAGDAWRHLYDNEKRLLALIMPQAKIFARVNPEEKAEIVDFYETLGFITSF